MTVVTVLVQVPPVFGAGLIVTGILTALAALLTLRSRTCPHPQSGTVAAGHAVYMRAERRPDNGQAPSGATSPPARRPTPERVPSRQAAERDRAGAAGFTYVCPTTAGPGIAVAVVPGLTC